jgi:hypothetical protein
MLMAYAHLLILGLCIVLGWFVFMALWPRMMVFAYKRAILAKGFGEGPVPINTLCTEPEALFADPLHPPASAPKVATSGTNRDTLLTVGWLDLKKGPQILHVPDMAGRYYAVQFIDPSKNTNFAYVGKRTTGTEAADYIIVGPRHKGALPRGIAQILSPSNSVLIIGRVLVESDSDLPVAHALTKEIQVFPLTAHECNR